MDLTTTVDLHEVARAGELYLVQDSVALLLHKWPNNYKERGFGRFEYGLDWVLVCAASAAEAIHIAKAYDLHPTVDVRDYDGFVALLPGPACTVTIRDCDSGMRREMPGGTLCIPWSPSHHGYDSETGERPDFLALPPTAPEAHKLISCRENDIVYVISNVPAEGDEDLVCWWQSIRLL